MADLDEGLIAHQEEEARKREEEERKKTYFQERLEKARQGRRVLKKALSTGVKTQVKKTALKLALRAILAYVLPVVLSVLGIIFLVIIVIVAMCSTWTGRLAVGVGTRVAIGSDVCKTFEGLQGIVNYIDSGKVPAVPTN